MNPNLLYLVLQIREIKVLKKIKKKKTSPQPIVALYRAPYKSAFKRKRKNETKGEIK